LLKKEGRYNNVNVLSTTEPVHLNMINMANFMLCLFHHYLKKKEKENHKRGKRRKAEQKYVHIACV